MRLNSAEGSGRILALDRSSSLPIHCQLRPPLRRFAVGRALQRGLIPAGDALRLASRLQGKGGGRPDSLVAGGVIADRLDAIDGQDEKARAATLRAAQLRFPRAQVSGMTLEWMERTGRGDQPRSLARRDKDGKVRAWAESRFTTRQLDQPALKGQDADPTTSG